MRLTAGRRSSFTGKPGPDSCQRLSETVLVRLELLYCRTSFVSPTSPLTPTWRFVEIYLLSFVKLC